MEKDGQNLAEKFLAMAQEAEKQALKCNDRAVRDKWLKIALSYREMAQRRMEVPPNEGSSEQAPAPPGSQLPLPK